jgi:hypothetical protein
LLYPLELLGLGGIIARWQRSHGAVENLNGDCTEKTKARKRTADVGGFRDSSHGSIFSAAGAFSVDSWVELDQIGGYGLLKVKELKRVEPHPFQTLHLFEGVLAD